MRGYAVALCTAALLGAAPVPEATLRGTVLEWDHGSTGDMSVRAADNHVYCFRFSPVTVVERDGLKGGVAQLRKGDTVDVVTTQAPGYGLRQARVVRVVASRPRSERSRVASTMSRSTELDELFPRGNLQLAGIVQRVDSGLLVLRTRTQGNLQIRLRDDTRYLGNGRDAGRSALLVNTRVYVRAGRTYENDLEAFQVVWGRILGAPAR